MDKYTEARNLIKDLQETLKGTNVLGEPRLTIANAIDFLETNFPKSLEDIIWEKLPKSLEYSRSWADDIAIAIRTAGYKKD